MYYYMLESAGDLGNMAENTGAWPMIHPLMCSNINQLIVLLLHIYQLDINHIYRPEEYSGTVEERNKK
jgi:hypothetical protein